MTRTTMGKYRKNVARKPSPGGNRTLGPILAGLSASGGSMGGFTPNDGGLIPAGEDAPPFTPGTVDGGSVSVGG